MTKHTPGPWHVNPKPPENRVSEHGDDPYTIASGDHRLIARICVQGGETSDNAALIAAAPKLLEAMEKIAAETEDVGPPFRVLSREAMRGIARAAIAEVGS